MAKQITIQEQIIKLNEKRKNLEDRLRKAKAESSEKFSRLGWGAGMRRSKISLSYSKEEKIEMRLKDVQEQIKYLQAQILI